MICDRATNTEKRTATLNVSFPLSGVGLHIYKRAFNDTQGHKGCE